MRSRKRRRLPSNARTGDHQVTHCSNHGDRQYHCQQHSHLSTNTDHLSQDQHIPIANIQFECNKMQQETFRPSVSNRKAITRSPTCQTRFLANFCKPIHQPRVVTILSLSTLFIIFYIETCMNSSNTLLIGRPVASQRSVRLHQQPIPQQQSFPPYQQPASPPAPTPAHVTSATASSSRFNLPELISQQGGVVKDKNITLTKQYNPILITRDIVIKKDAKLTIGSGVELLFEKRKGIIVYGTLEILGTPDDRVKLDLLKSQQSATVNFRSHNNNPNGQQQVRLVDGELPSEGRVQVKFNDRWHSLCTNSKNLTAADIRVICRQVGHQDGHWYKWFPRRNETTFQIMSKSFHCTGTENAISSCKRWNRVRAGGGICDYHSDIGIRCTKTLAFASPIKHTGSNTDSSPASSTADYEFWRGIEFINSEFTYGYVLDGQMKQKVSKSSIRYASFSDAGVNEVGNATSAIRVTGQPPSVNDIEIKNSIYGIMIEDVDDAISLKNIRLFNNMGNPLFINTSWGKVSLDGLHIEGNGGDGVRIARHEKIRLGPHDFCKFANLGPLQSFPIVLSHEQTFFTKDRDCCQEFLSSHQLTVHFPVLRSTPNNLLPESDANRRISIPAGVSIGKDANLVIYDDYRDEFPFKLKIQNGTRAQSIVSKSGRLKICYEPANYRTVLFAVEVVADVDDEWSGKARDVEISNSYIKGNEGRGIWIENQRSGLMILNTTVLNHNYLAGVHVENGTGEVIVQASTFSNNIGHGLFINLAGGYYHVDNSTISDNSLKGIAIEYDKRPELVPFNHTMHLGYSLIARNGENGLFIGNVCRSDAFWNISMNSFIKNGEDAIHFQSCLPTHELVLNFKNLSSRLNLSDANMLFYNGNQEVLVTHNIFLANARGALKIAPVAFVRAQIRHNMFREHPLATLFIGNQLISDQDSELYAQSPAYVRVASNRFYSNRGRYVANVGVQEDNPKQSLVFTKNTLDDNTITEPYNDLKPRSRVSAVVVVSSSNTRLIRNRFNNPRSAFEMGSHLEMHYKTINATTNFWGPGLDATAIYKRIFDRKNRYNLAQIEFLQYLLSPEDLEYATDLSFDRERDKISTFRNGTRLGGEVKGYDELPADTYIVQDDIFVRPGAHLILKPGTTLKFDDGIGVMVQGRLDAIGQVNSQIVFTSALASNRLPQRAMITTTQPPVANPWVSHQPADGIGSESEDNRPSSSSLQRSPQTDDETIARERRQVSGFSGAQNARLSHTTMGRLEVHIDGAWGSVCDHNFDIEDAAVVCQQLGMILNKDDWLLERFQYAANDRQQISMLSTNALMTNLRCDPTLDIDVTKCKAEISSRGDFDGMCNSEVGIRCFPPSWSGVRLGMGAEVSTIEHVTIQRAGMFDYADYKLTPALQVDFNRHLISSVVIKSNSDSGLGILWNDVIGRHFNELAITDSKMLNNERHGIELRSRGLSIRNCMISNNRQNGLDYNPSFSQREINDLLSWLHTAKNSDNIVTVTFPLKKQSYFPVPSSEDSYRFFVFQRNPPADVQETFTIGTDPGHMLSIHLLNPIHLDSTESLNMSIGTNPESPVWDFRVNMTSFPMISPGYKFHFNYSTGDRPRGNMILYIRSRYNNRDLKLLAKHIPAYLVMHKFEQTAININSKLINSLVITNSSITKNGIGLRFRHPNYHYSMDSAYNLRYANETTNITNNLIEGNNFSSIFVGSDDLEWSLNYLNQTISPAEIHYNLLGNRIRRNKDGIRQFSRDVRFTQNVFHWSINDTIFDQNRSGAINLVLPYYWRYDTNLSHTVEMHNNSFLRNQQFEFLIDGHFAKVNLSRNIFRDNKCKRELMAISGMEKQVLIRYNVFEQNICSRIVEFNIHSHADKLGSILAEFEFNLLRYNRKPASNSIPLGAQPSTSGSTPVSSNLLKRLHPQASDYAMSLRGIQAVNISRNLFVNPDLRYELVVAIMMDAGEDVVNAMENYWGSVLPSYIAERVFDFDDWNSYAVAEFNPYLTQESFESATIFGGARDVARASSGHLGGRLTMNLTLPYRREAYLVESDLTVMPNVRLVIEKGAVLEFMPNVGILVLGDMIAAGTREKPILMRPAFSAADVAPMHQYLFPPRTKPNLLIQINPNDPPSYDHNYALKHNQLAYPIDLGSIRLCKNEICNDGSHIYENNVEDQTLRQEVLKSSNSSWKMDGFLEIFNMTNLQWVPVCDPLFTEHIARVACRQLGYSHLSLFKRGRRYTIEQEQIISIRRWPQSLQCEGDEANLASCRLAAAAYNNHSTACNRESNQFVYVYCQDFPDGSQANQLATHGRSDEHAHHWGGVRFSCPSAGAKTNNNQRYQGSNANDPVNNLISSQYGPSVRSRLQYVTIDRAGMLHHEKSAALQVFQRNVQIEFVAVTNSAHHGLEIITSSGNQNFHQLRLRNNLGVGLYYLSLTGSSSASRLVPYLPLKHLDISRDTFGLVNICGASKEIRVEERLLLFYQYSSHSVDCVKIITSKLKIKQIGVRMLQFDLFNSTAHTSRPDHVRLYDGDIFDRDSHLLVDLGVTEKHRQERPELRFYQTTGGTMSIRLHVSGASSLYGFIAEVVTTPVSYNIERDVHNNITFSELTGNKMGAMTIASAGESSPNLMIRNNRIESNCLHLFGNFTSCPSAIYMELQNCQRLGFIGNLLRDNQGGAMVKSYSHSAVSALDATLEGNVFEDNHNTNTLTLQGPKTDPYQTVKVVHNFFTRNVAQYLSNIVLSRIVSNFSYNIISGNTGRHQIEVTGFDKMPLSYQTFDRNWIYNNIATMERDRSTIFGNSAGQQYLWNYFVNPDNHYEISTMNWSRYDVRPYHVPKDDEIIHLAAGDGSSRDVFRKTAQEIPISIVDTKKNILYQATINAKHNWWGFNSTPAIQGRIRDRLQHEELIKVDFTPFLDTNHSVLSDICAGGWQRVGDACLIYVGARMTYQEARDFCDRERATLPLLRGNHHELTEFIRSHQRDYDPRVDRIWLRSFEVARDACPALYDVTLWPRTKNYDCQDKHAFLCEKDPQIVVSLLHWHREAGGLVALILASVTIILTVCCTICWGYKSRQRHREKLERKSSIYASMRSNRGAPYSASSNSLSELFLHRQIYNPDKSSITDLSLSTQLTQPASSVDGSHQVRLDPSAGFTATSSYSTGKVRPASSHQSEPAPAYANTNRSPYEMQPPLNPAYMTPGYRTPSASPVGQQTAKQFSVSTNPNGYASRPTSKPPPTPRPMTTYREHSGSLAGSRSPSYTSSHNGSLFDQQVLTDPMPVQTFQMQQIQMPMPSGAQTNAIDYSRIDHEATRAAAEQVRLPPEYNANSVETGAGRTADRPQMAYDGYNNGQFSYGPATTTAPTTKPMPDIDESESSVPTYYSNQTYEESTQSYLEAYKEGLLDVYNQTLQQMNNDQVSFVLTERSSITDLLINSSQITHTSSIDSQTDLVNMNPQVSSDYNAAMNAEFVRGANNKAYSETGSQNLAPNMSNGMSKAYSTTSTQQANPNRYCVETSFESETPTMAPMMGSFASGNQARISPVSSSYTAPDSKLGSRVYLETSFE